jgi:uncharacterized glyoxalase superfamily protein PhnB
VTEPIRPLPDAVPVLPVADLVRALVWYERAGFTIDAEHPGYVLLRFDGTEVHLVEVPEVEGLDTWTGAYLRVADVDALFARWQALSLPVLAEPDDRAYGVREMALEDPDGNLWRVGSPLPSFDELLTSAAVPASEPSTGPAGPAEAPEPAGGSERAEAPDVCAADTGILSTDAAMPSLRSDGGPGTSGDAWFRLVAEGDRRCAGCGWLPGELPARALGAQVRDEAHAFGLLLAAADDDGLRTRPAPRTWSALEYGVHVRDVLNLFSERIIRTLAEHEPELGWWDHEAAIDDGMANESDVGAVVDDLGRNASKLSEALRLVDEDDWPRGATRHPGQRFTIELMARFALHEVVHHRADAERSLAAAR